ncbi:MAG TPA: hypothetical protein VFR78_02830 [Pyrinomonadaceae bacterium]|nr:hypothetical protein [Pyrinomonadaceae bacterium]
MANPEILFHTSSAYTTGELPVAPPVSNQRTAVVASRPRALRHPVPTTISAADSHNAGTARSNSY